MLYLILSTPLLLLALELTSVCVSIHQTTATWRSEDQELAQKAESWVPRLKRIYDLNSALLKIETACHVTIDPFTLSALKTSAASLEALQDGMWLTLKTELLFYELRSTQNTVSSPNRQAALGAKCIKGLWGFEESQIAHLETQHAGIELLYSSNQPLWRFKKNSLRRLL